MPLYVVSIAHDCGVSDVEVSAVSQNDAARYVKRDCQFHRVRVVSVRKVGDKHAQPPQKGTPG